MAHYILFHIRNNVFHIFFTGTIFSRVMSESINFHSNIKILNFKLIASLKFKLNFQVTLIAN